MSSVLIQKSRRATFQLVMNNCAIERRRADVVRLRADFRHRPEQERAQSIEVLGERAERHIRP